MTSIKCWFPNLDPSFDHFPPGRHSALYFHAFLNDVISSGRGEVNIVVADETRKNHFGLRLRLLIGMYDVSGSKIFNHVCMHVQLSSHREQWRHGL